MTKTDAPPSAVTRRLDFMIKYRRASGARIPSPDALLLMKSPDGAKTIASPVFSEEIRARLDIKLKQAYLEFHHLVETVFGREFG